MGYIYKIENSISGKIYIGQTRQDFNKRYCAKGNGIERVYNYHKNNKNNLCEKCNVIDFDTKKQIKKVLKNTK